MKHHFYTFGLFVAMISNAQAATITKTKITKISVTPTSAPAGTMFKFTATLNAPLTTGNKVKIDLGKGLASMTGSGTQFALSRAFYTTGKQTYKVGIYNAKNVLQGVVKNGTYSVTSAAAKLNHAPTLTDYSGDYTITINDTISLTFYAHDTDGNLNSITMDWGDGSAPETLAATEKQGLAFNHIYATLGSFVWSAAATDNGTPALSSDKVTKKITVVEAGKYTKVCNSGALAGEEDCPASPVLGNAATNWGCTQDDKTGLIWEVKTTDGGLRDQSYTYTWYEPDNTKNGGFEGFQNRGSCKGSDCDTYSYKNAVNEKSLCGASDWRMPTIEELSGIVKSGVTNPSIDTTYFPNTSGLGFWSSLPDPDFRSGAAAVYFNGGGWGSYTKGSNGNVRLVR